MLSTLGDLRGVRSSPAPPALPPSGTDFPVHSGSRSEIARKVRRVDQVRKDQVHGPSYVPPLPPLSSRLDLGHDQAAEKGPVTHGERVVRRKVYRKSNNVVGQALRVFKF